MTSWSPRARSRRRSTRPRSRVSTCPRRPSWASPGWSSPRASARCGTRSATRPAIWSCCCSSRRRFGAYTIPDFAAGRLGSRGLRQTATVLVLIIGTFYLLPQMKGAGITLQAVLGTPYWVGVAVLGAVVSCNIAMGGMKGITFVQCFQYWLKLCAIGIPAAVLLIATGHDSARNLAPDQPPVFTHATVVDLTQATSFTLTRSATATVTGLLDQRTLRDQPVHLCACQHVAGAGTR